MHEIQSDQMTDGDEDYIYRDGNWTTKAGYCVNTARAHALTLKFYARHGRPPTAPQKPTPAARRASTKAAKVKTAAVRAAVAKALAAKSGKRAPKVAPPKAETAARAKRTRSKS